MVVAQESLQNNIITKNIIIQNYLNIWANHNNNDLGSIQFKQIDSGDDIVLPYQVKIKYKGLVFKISKI